MADALDVLGNLTRKYRSGAYSGSTYSQPKVAERASRIAAQQQRQPMRRQPITEEDEALLDRLEDLDDLDDDEEQQQTATINRTRRQQQEPTSRPARGVSRPPMRHQQQRKHPSVYIGSTVVVLVLAWLLTTVGLSWFVTSFVDPGTYGPLHGNVVSGVFGGGDSASQPSKLIGWNNNGQIEIIKVTANDPSKARMIVGPNLIMLNFPDPTNAKIQIQLIDYDHDGHLDVQVNVLSSVYDYPLHRFSQPYLLYGDGKGNLKPRQTAPAA
jgi:hypothetical protein